jgi:predicted porin
MKKKLVGLVVYAVAGAACAQSSVTLFGVVDANLQHASQGGAKVVRLLGGGSNSSSRLGFRGVEDLGSGLSASFWLEAGVNVDSGTGGATSANNITAAPPSGLTFNRRSTVSLTSSTLGELRIGRDYTPSFWNLTLYDPFGTVGAGASTSLSINALNQSATTQTGIRASNSVGYILPPTLGGIYGQAMVALGENASNAPGGASKDGNFASFRLGFARGPVDVAAAYGKTRLSSGDVTVANVGASYDLGFATLMGQVFTDRKDATVAGGANRSKGWLIGAKVPVGAGYIPLSFGQAKDNSNAASGSNDVKLFAIGYVHNLSRRTALYTTYAHIRNGNRAAVSGGGTVGVAGASWTGLDAGIRHSF